MSPSSECKILFVGEAWGQQEEELSLRKKKPCPFVGSSGFFLLQTLFNVGLLPKAPPVKWPGALQMHEIWESLSPQIKVTNVFQQRPGLLGDSVDQLFDNVPDECPEVPRLGPKQFLKAENLHHLHRLQDEIAALRPNLVVLLGRTALWAVLQRTDISEARGSIFSFPSGKALPTYHPAAIFRRFSLQPVFHADLMKARIESSTAEIFRLRRNIWTSPSVEDLWTWWNLHGKNSPLISIDIETVKSSLISEVGFAASKTEAIHIPFILEDKARRHFSLYWESFSDEIKAWKFVRHVCECSTPKIGQNILYDIQYLWKVMGIRVKNLAHDTMLQHHALFPGMDKGLGFLASIYCNERTYKGLRRHSNKDDE